MGGVMFRFSGHDPHVELYVVPHNAAGVAQVFQQGVKRHAGGDAVGRKPFEGDRVGDTRVDGGGAVPDIERPFCAAGGDPCDLHKVLARGAERADPVGFDVKEERH